MVTSDPPPPTLFSGAAVGAEAEFGYWAEIYGIEEVNFTFEGHEPARHRGLRHLSADELARGEAALAGIGRIINRQFPEGELFRRLLLSIWHQIHHGEAIFVVGRIQGDGTVTGGTGWGAEYAKQCNKPLYIFDQERGGWYRWRNGDWEPEAAPVVTHPRFTGTGTRFLEPNGKEAIARLFEQSFGAAGAGAGEGPTTRLPPSPEE